MPNEHLGHHIGPPAELPTYEDADMLATLHRLRAKWAAECREIVAAWKKRKHVKLEDLAGGRCDNLED